MAEPLPVSIAVVGAPGHIGRRHTQDVFSDPSSTLSCIVDPTPAGPSFAATLNVPLYLSVEAMLAARAAGMVKVDGAILATPNATHVPLGILLLEAGVHTLVEKPMATDIESGRRSGLWTTFKPLHYYKDATSWRALKGTGGVILINLVHDIDLFRFLFGDITRVYCEEGARTRGHPVEETGALTMRFKSGTVGTFVFSDAVVSPYNMESATGENPDFPYKGQNTYTILGTKGSTSFPELKRWHYANPDGCWTDELALGPAEDVENIPPFTRQLAHFMDVCRGNAAPLCSGLEALKSIITVEAIRQSMRTGLPVDIAQS